MNTFQLLCLKAPTVITYTDVIFKLWFWYNVPGIERALLKVPHGIILEGTQCVIVT